MRERDRRRLDLLKAFLEGYKAAKKCEHCPETDPVTFDFHHTDPAQKDLDISQAIHNRWSIGRIKLELAKTIVLCGNCHRKEHRRLRQMAGGA